MSSFLLCISQLLTLVNKFFFSVGQIKAKVADISRQLYFALLLISFI